MNTMYRKNKVAGYQQVQDAIDHKEDMLLPSDKISYIDYLADKLKPITGEEVLQNTLCELAEGILDSEWSVETQGEILKNFTDLDNVPKTLLHVHSTVGLSVNGLGTMIKEWNEKHDDSLKIYHADVNIPHYKTVNNILLFKIQAENLKQKDPELVYEPVTGDWFDRNKKSFYLSSRKDIKTNWEAFGEIFMRTEHLFQDKDFYKFYHMHFFIECLKNNIRYVELRTGYAEFTDWAKPKEIENGIVFLRPGFNMKEYFYHSDPLKSPNPHSPDVNFLQSILDAKKDAEAKYDSRTIEVKVILTANRNKTMRNMEDTCKKIDTAIAIKNGIGSENTEIANMIVGFDFVDKEENTWGLTDELYEIMYDKFHCEGSKLTPKLRRLMEKSRMQLMRFFLHNGESTEIISDCGSNAVTGPICSRHRIGHGFQMGAVKNFDENNLLYGNRIVQYILNGHGDDIGLQNYPVIKSVSNTEYTREDYITEPVIELCPISNYMLGYVDKLQEHPAITLMKNGILAVICNDDPQLFYSEGLNYDYVMMYIALLNYYKDPNDGINDRAKEEALKYLKKSLFLGFFYKEMSKYYYKSIEEDNEKITVVNDDLTIIDVNSQVITERRIIDIALESFSKDWKEFVSRFKKKSIINETT